MRKTAERQVTIARAVTVSCVRCGGGYGAYGAAALIQYSIASSATLLAGRGTIRMSI